MKNLHLEVLLRRARIQNATAETPRMRAENKIKNGIVFSAFSSAFRAVACLLLGQDLTDVKYEGTKRFSTFKNRFVSSCLRGSK